MGVSGECGGDGDRLSRMTGLEEDGAEGGTSTSMGDVS